MAKQYLVLICYREKSWEVRVGRPFLYERWYFVEESCSRLAEQRAIQQFKFEESCHRLSWPKDIEKIEVSEYTEKRNGE